MKTQQFLGLAILATRLKPGQAVTLAEMRIWQDAAAEVMADAPEYEGPKVEKICSERFRQIEERSLRKIRIHVTRELNNHAKEVLFDGLRLLSQTNINLWDQQTKRLQ